MRVIITAGGTGGHIYPAIAIINKIKAKEPNSEILYIGTHNRMEKDIVPSYDINYMSLEVTGFKRKLTLSNFKTIVNFIKAIKKAKKIVKDFNPDIVIGVGGYVTAPVIYAAKKLKYKTFIHEQNSVPGLSNKFLSHYADRIGVSLPGSMEYFPNDKVVFTGNPCSEVAITKKAVDKSIYGFPKGRKLVLMVLGSLGSKILNQKMIKSLSLFNNKEYDILYVTGKNYYEETIKNNKFPNNVKVVPYIENMSCTIKISDLMVTRAGATTISEITALGVPSIIIPSPHVTNNHQMKNAIELVNKKAAILLEEKDIQGDILVRMIDDLFKDINKYNTMKKNSKELGIADSATRVYNVLKDVMSR
jgi:UDP-N-acetylglucosamine--N-acetylmuramyl-(pentapeptide) pyrophosphoryl-undecaprenol N-acetylglucosamine transferase